MSILGQTFRHFELIVVDDGSSDDLLEVIATLNPPDARLRVVRQENAGLASARNRGLREARGELIAFIDADDLWHPRFLEDVTAALEAEPDAPFGYALFTRIDTENRIIPTPLWQHVPRHDFIGLVEINTVGNGSAAVFRREAVVSAGGFDVSLRQRGAQGAEDWKLILTLAARHAPALVMKQLVCYRQVPDGMSRKRPEFQMRSVHVVMDEIRRGFPGTAESHFRNARTAMNGWLMPAFLSAGSWRTVLRMFAESYLLNPLWFLSRDLRTLHLQKLRSTIESRKPRVHLGDLIEDGARPFGFLRDPASLE